MNDKVIFSSLYVYRNVVSIRIVFVNLSFVVDDVCSVLPYAIVIPMDLFVANGS